MLVGAKNESLGIILIYYMFKYWVWNKTTLLDSLQSPKKTNLKSWFKESYKDLVFARGEFLRLYGAQNECLRLIIIEYILKYIFGIKITLLESLRSQKTLLKARFMQN